jgi:Sulfotransferase family
VNDNDGTLITSGRSGNSNELPAGDADDVHVLYIAGIGRSGSTLLCRTLGSVDGLLATGELMRILGRGVINGDLCSCGAPVANCDFWRAVLADLEGRCPDLDLERLEHTRKRVTEGWELLRYLFLPNENTDLGRALEEYRQFLSALYGSIQNVTGSQVVVDASKNLLFARLLTETPGVKLTFLHLVRDSRGVAHSLMRKQRRPGTANRREYFRQQGPLLGSILWSTAHVTTERLAVRTSRLIRVRYEDFVSDPAATVSGVLDRLDPVGGPSLPSHVNGRSVRLGRDHLIASNPNRAARGVVTLREDAAWRHEMTPVRQWLVTSLTAPLLRRYGYRVRPGREPEPRVRPIVTRQPEP